MKFDVILVRYGELTTKGRNRLSFINNLIDNLIHKLSKWNGLYSLQKEHDRLFIHIKDLEDTNEIEHIVKNTFGIYSLSFAKVVSKDLEKVNEVALDLVKYYNPKTFKIEARRSDKTFEYISIDINKIVSTHILKNSDVKVDVHNPEMMLEVEVRRENIYVFVSRIKGLGGLPVGASGRGLVLLSGGIDSPVASFLTMKRGMSLEYIHFITPPSTKQEALDKVIELVKKLSIYNNKKQQVLHVVNFTLLQNEIMHIKDPSYRITIMRRMFVRIANKVARLNRLSALITGESLGQVASQTIESITTINDASKMVILRPLICLDKTDIVAISKQIGTYDISIKPFEDCCSLFVPKNPVTKPRTYLAISQEKDIMWEEIISAIMDQHIVTYYIDKDGNIEKR